MSKKRLNGERKANEDEIDISKYMNRKIDRFNDKMLKRTDLFSKANPI